MYTAQKTRKENIAEYILYLWQQVFQLPEVEDVFGDVFAPFDLGYIHDVVFVSLLSVRCVPFRLPQHVRRASLRMKKPDRLR